MTKKIKSRYMLLTRIFTATFFTLIISFLISITITGIYSSPHTITALDSGWVDVDGNTFALNSFTSTTKEAYIADRCFISLNSTKPNTSLIFRARNVFTDIFIDDEMIYEDSKGIMQIFGTSPGSRWHIVPIGEHNEPFTICIRGVGAYYNSNGTVDNIYIGNTHDVYKQIIGPQIVGFVICNILTFIGICLVIFYFFLSKKMRMEKDVVYLGMLTIFCSLWAGAETHIWQLFLGCSELFHTISYVALMCIPVSFGLLSYCRLSGKPKKLAHIYTIISVVYVVLAFMLHFTDIFEFHFTMHFTHYLLVPLLVPFIFLVTKSYTTSGSKKTEKQKKTGVYMSVIYLLIFVSSLGIALVKYIKGSYGSNYSTYIRITILFFLSCLILCQLNTIIDTFSKGLQTDMIKELAFKDYLTKLYNRTAFSEFEKKYIKMIDEGKPIGIIQFDVNNLKLINDTLGHDKGDQMIFAVAVGLRKAFSKNAQCFRMGGDEFMVVLTGDSPSEAYREGFTLLREYCMAINRRKDLGFRLQIAHGFIIVKNKSMTLAQAMEKADDLMYTNKKALKDKSKLKQAR